MDRRLRPLAARVAAVVALAALYLAAPAAALAFASASPAPTPAESAPAADGDASELITFGIAPASAGRPDARSYVAVTAPPGSVVYDDVAVLNQSDVPLDLAVYPADAVNDAAGALGLPPRAQAPGEAGGWIGLGASAVSVPAQSTEAGIGFVVVPVTITIPLDAEPGDHVAGVVAAITTEGEAGANTPAISLEQRTGARIYITVDGPTKAGLTVTGVRGVYTPGRALGLAGAGRMTVTYTLTNTGNIRLGVEPAARVSSLFGLLAQSADGARVDELLPGSSVEQSIVVDDVWPLVLDSVTVSAPAVAAIGRDDPGIATATGSAFVWAIPWALLAILVLLVGGWLLLRRRRSRARTGGGRHSGGGTPAAPSAPAELPVTSPVLRETQVVP